MNDPRRLALTTRILASLALGMLWLPTGAGASPPILPYGLWVMDADGTDARRLLRYTSHDEVLPEWSPDGTRVVVERAQQILIVEVATGGKTLITEEGSNWEPTWAPDGTSIAFTGAHDQSRTDIYTVAADGTDIDRLTMDPRRDQSPEWSPDGKTVAFIRHGKSGGLYIVDAASKKETRLVGGVYGPIDWSPNGDQTLFTSAYDIWVVNADGSGVANLTRSDRWEIEAAWAPAGDQVAYCAGSSIFVIAADGSDRNRLMKGTDCLFGFSWAADGTLAFSKGGDIWSIRPDGTGARRIARTRAGEVSPSWSPTGDHVAYLRK
jgi:TolB protein